MDAFLPLLNVMTRLVVPDGYEVRWNEEKRGWEIGVGDWWWFKPKFFISLEFVRDTESDLLTIAFREILKKTSPKPAELSYQVSMTDISVTSTNDLGALFAQQAENVSGRRAAFLTAASEFVQSVPVNDLSPEQAATFIQGLQAIVPNGSKRSAVLNGIVADLNV